MRNPSKNTIKRFVKAEAKERKNIAQRGFLYFASKSFLVNSFAINRILKLSKGKISISNLRGCQRYGYMPIQVGIGNLTSDMFKQVVLLLGSRKEKHEMSHPLFAPRLKDVPVVVGIDVGRENVNDIAVKSISVMPDSRVYGHSPWHNTLRGDMYQMLLSDINASRLKLPERNIIDFLKDFHNTENYAIEE